MSRIAGLTALGIALSLSSNQAWARPVSLKLTKTKIVINGRRPTKRAVRAHLVRGLSDIRTCVKGAVKDKRHFNGWLWLNFKFSKSGRIYGVSVTSTLTNRFVHKCIDMSARHWRMPRGAGGSVTSQIRIRK